MAFLVKHACAAISYIVLGAVLGWLPIPAAALHVKPMIFDMSAVGPDSRKTITISSDSATPVPMELVVNRLDLGPNGELIKTPGGDEDFLIFPPQTIVPPNSTQTFRLQWAGDPELAESRSYNISVNQIPVDTVATVSPGEKKLALQLTFNFVTTVTVRPAKGISTFQVNKAEVSKTAKGKPAVALTIENTGNMHNYLAGATLELKAGAWTKKLKPVELRSRIGYGLVLPKHTRRIVVPIDDLPKKPGLITASVRFSD